MDEVTCLQVCPRRGLCDVIAQVFKLFRAADQMVEVIDLPEPSLAREPSVNAHSSEMLPRIALRQHLLGVWKHGENVNMVRHDHKVGEAVPIPVKMAQAVCHDP